MMETIIPHAVEVSIMGKRIFGWVLFIWMSMCVVGAGREMLSHGGVWLASDVGACLFCVAVGLIGLAMELGKTKSPKPPVESP
jgi:hypothetical protein